MDETDLRLINLLILDSRTPYSVLARRLNMSIPAVHKRVTALHEAGVVTRFTANLSVPFLQAIQVYVWGVSEAFPLRNAIESMGKNGLTQLVITGSGNLLHMHALLPTIQDLGPYVAYVQKAASIPTPQVGIVAVAVFGKSPRFPASYHATDLDRLDYRILLALHDDARKPIADICEEIRASPKTVRSRLRRMVERNVIEFSIQAQPGVHAVESALIPIQLKPGVDVGPFRARMVSDLDPWLVWAWTFSNAPNVLTAMTACITPEAHERLVSRISSYEGVERLSIHLISHYDFFEMWRDKLLKRRAAGDRV